MTTTCFRCLQKVPYRDADALFCVPCMVNKEELDQLYARLAEAEKLIASLKETTEALKDILGYRVLPANKAVGI